MSIINGFYLVFTLFFLLSFFSSKIKSNFNIESSLKILRPCNVTVLRALTICAEIYIHPLFWSLFLLCLLVSTANCLNTHHILYI